VIGFSNWLAEAQSNAAAKLAQLRARNAKPNEKKAITKKELNDLEKTLDALFKHLKIDIEFSKHFFDRLHDKRNGKDITIAELNALFVAVHNKFGTVLSHKPDEFEAVMKSISTKLNVPFVIKLTKKGEIELISKTVMRKANFKTPNQELKV